MKICIRGSICVALLATALTGCSSSSDSGDGDDTTNNNTGTTNTDGAKAVVTAAKDKINKSLLMAASSSLRANNYMNTAWSEASLTDEAGDECDAMTTPKSHIQELQDKTCTTSPVFDLNNMFDIMCAIGAALEADATTGLPKAGTFQPEITEAIATECGIADAKGMKMPAVVEDITGNNYYQKKIKVTTATDRVIYMGKNGTAVYLSFMYGDTSTYRGFYSYDSTKKQMQFELQAHNDSADQVSFFRIFRDEVEAVAEVKMVGSYKDKGASKNVRWTMFGPASGDSKIAVEMSWAGQTSGTGLKTCVNRSDFSADGAVSECGDFSAPAVATFGPLMETIITAFASKTEAEYQALFGPEDYVNFTDENIESATQVN